MHNMTDTAKVLIADGSKLARSMTERLVKKIQPYTEVIAVDSVAKAIEKLQNNRIDIILSALRLPDDDGTKICEYARENHHYLPVIIISGSVDARLKDRMLSSDVTDYIDKAAGQKGLEIFLSGLLRPDDEINGKILYIEDSMVVAHATKKLLQNHNLEITHKLSVTDAKEVMPDRETSYNDFDLVLTDYYLKNNETARGILSYARDELHLNKLEMPFVIMTGDENTENQKQILNEGANDLVGKPVNQEALVKKLKFQIRFTQFHRQKDTS
ncbi:response regulator [Marinicella rhabdoformis]|uniref:response regulator n=1 Tax=Marinicella rhabdoformis TaxID=2580566 RepID=UPI0012AEBDE4|nr:response regulator [Marinicella rhabdoformis]